jgi:hypothetical protein
MSTNYLKTDEKYTRKIYFYSKSNSRSEDYKPLAARVEEDKQIGDRSEDVDRWNAYIDNLHRSHVSIREEHTVIWSKNQTIRILLSKTGIQSKFSSRDRYHKLVVETCMETKGAKENSHFYVDGN